MRKDIDLSYPRPLLKRNSFFNLNGKWDFLLEDKDVGEREPRFKQFPKDCFQINVPFCYQSINSGINIQKRYDTVWYHRNAHFDYKDDQRVILHFDAADYLTYVYVNAKLVGKHQGGYTSFAFDITDYLIDGNASIAVRCDDTYDLHQPRGKQKWREESFGCWYQEVNGIWKDVWAEVVEDVHIDNIRLTPKRDGIMNLNISLNKLLKGITADIEVYLDDELVAKQSHELLSKEENIDVLLGKIAYWGIDNPILYDVKITLSNDDAISSIFGYRFIEAKQGKLFLNDKPLFMRLTLEQGYYPEGIYTFKDKKQMVDEINYILEAGFNGLRMHQKVEDDRFYYLCDIKGLIAWSEMPSSYDFDDNTRSNALREWKEVLTQHYNHPSILVWTPCNESWGVPGIRHNKEQQDFLDELYDLTKAFDPIRLVVSNDGWEHCKTDLITLHNYTQNPEEFKKVFVDELLAILKENKKVDEKMDFVPFADGYHYEGQPILIDEFCGTGYNVASRNDGWGYGMNVNSKEEFYDRYEKLVKVATDSELVSGWCMTQMSDVYQEINGLLTFSREKKYDFDRIKKINTYKGLKDE